MKKLLLSLAAVVGLGFAANAAEATYTITFVADAASNNNGPAIDENTTLATVIADGADYVESFSEYTQAYAACNSGLKLGANKQAGALTINLSELGSVNATKVVVYASASKNATYQKLSVNGTEFSFTTDEVKDTYKSCEITPSEKLTSIVLKKTNASTTSKEQGFVFVEKIVVTYESTGVVKPGADLSFGDVVSFSAVLGEDFTAPTLINPYNVPVTYTSSDEGVATVDEAGNVLTVGTGTTIITAASEETDEYRPGKVSYTLTVSGRIVSVIKATEMKAGKFMLAHESSVGYFAPQFAGAAYGYIKVTEATVEGSALKTSEDNYFTFTAVEGGYNIQLADGRYLYLDGSHASFNVSDDTTVSGGNYVWSVTLDATTGAATITNVNRNMTIAWDAKYGNFSTAEAPAADLLPVLYTDSNIQNGIDEIGVDANAPVEYYNLQGVRVANPENGIFIRRQGAKATKVFVK